MQRISYELLSLPVPFALWWFAFDGSFSTFWGRISISTLVLLLVSSARWRRMRFNAQTRMFAIGTGSAVLLYLFFWSGYHVAKAIPGFLQQVSGVYALGSGTSYSIIALLLLFPTGPGEELYWRGLIQGHLRESVGPAKAITITSTLYALIHLFTLNPSLMLVAFVGGLVWGYVYNRYANIFPIIVSHVLFDELIFVLLPIG